MEVSSPDRPGLLAQIGQILDGSNIAIQAAKIQTLGERVEDVFFLTNTDGNRLDDEATCEHLRMALCEALDKDVAA
jgi:[protein-PII] uridylyltransferase